MGYSDEDDERLLHKNYMKNRKPMKRAKPTRTVEAKARGKGIFRMDLAPWEEDLLKDEIKPRRVINIKHKSDTGEVGF